MSDAERPEVTIGPLQPGDEKEVLRLFKKVFNVDRSPAVWNWEFRDCPEGIHAFVGRTPDGRIVSQFCGIPVRMKVRDRSLVFAQIVDSMVDPEFRQGLKKPGLFATTVYDFVEHYGRLDREAVMFGLPNPPAFRIGQKLLGYTFLNDVQVLLKEIAPDPARRLEGGGDGDGGAGRPRIARVPVFSPDLDLFWSRLRERHEVVAERSARVMNWRYAGSPLWSYTLLEARSEGGALAGIAALRTFWLDKPDLAIAEWTVDHDDEAASEALLRHVEARAGRAGMRSVQVLVPPSSREHGFFAARGYAERPTRFRLVARTYDADVIPLDWLKSSWYYTLGDFDVV